MLKASRSTDHVQSGKSVGHDQDIFKSRCGGYGGDFDARNSEFTEDGTMWLTLAVLPP
jgi:hypothetical protein